MHIYTYAFKDLSSRNPKMVGWVRHAERHHAESFFRAFWPSCWKGLPSHWNNYDRLHSKFKMLFDSHLVGSMDDCRKPTLTRCAVILVMHFLHICEFKSQQMIVCVQLILYNKRSTLLKEGRFAKLREQRRTIEFESSFYYILFQLHLMCTWGCSSNFF